MQEHHIQKDILHSLVLGENLRFADLRPKVIDSNIFTYHLKQLIKDKLVAKNDDGTYCLTPLGRVAGINVTLSKKELLEQAHSILLMSLRTKEDGWLLRRRFAQPMFEKVGFVHGEPVAEEPAAETAIKTFQDRTGLTANFKPAGSGYVRLFKGSDLESFTHFQFFTADSYSGELIPKMRNGENYWSKNPDFESNEMIPSMSDLVRLISESDNLFYADLNYQV